MFAITMAGAVMSAAAYAYVQGALSEVEYVRSDVDGRTYLVQKGGDATVAANALGKINSDIDALIKHMREKYPSDERVHRIAQRFDPAAVSEGSSHTGYTSYSINKQKMVLCLRQTDDSFAAPNVVMYVALHELAHLSTDTIGHNSDFWTNFRWILKEAIEIGIYKKQDFASDPQPYCGIVVDSSVV